MALLSRRNVSLDLAANRAAAVPSGNKNARMHGMYALKRAVQERGLDAIDGRSALGRGAPRVSGRPRS
jgi:hypothetical protein